MTAGPPGSDGGAAAPRPLAGITVIDLTRVLAGPFCTMVLRDLGAEVIKVESPDGDDARRFGPFLDEQQQRSAYFASLNAGKRSVVLDLKRKEGAEAFAGLLEGADVLVENFRPGTLARLGFGREELERRNPRLISCSISGFGTTGPDAAKPAYDMIIQALSGLVSITGTIAGETVRVGTSISDIVSGLYAVIGITSALRRREVTGRGACIDLSMFDASVSVLENAIARYQVTGTAPVPLGTRHPSITPFEAFSTADRALVIAAGNDRLFAALCDVIGAEALARDARFVDNAIRTANAEALKEEIERRLRARPAAYWIEVLDAAGVPVAPINTVSDLFASPQVAARNMLVPVDGTDGFLVPGTPVKFADLDDLATRPPAPDLGEHTDEIIGGR